MVQGYYTLEESAEILGMSADELKQLARKGEIRSFQDRGTWRFRIQDIQEMARRSGKGSDPELPLGEALKPKPTDSPAPRSPSPKKKSDDVFGFSLGEDSAADVGSDFHLKPGSSKKTGSGKKLVEAGSDSDVRLVADGSDVSFQVPADSDVKVVEDEGPKSGPRSGKSSMTPPRSPRPARSKPETPEPEPDSGVRLVPMDSDSDVRIVGDHTDEEKVIIGDSPMKGATDSDIRLEGHVPPPRGDHEGLLTEEINLDEELKKDEARREAEVKQAKQRAIAPDFPKTSPFELSESDLELEPINEQKLPQVKDPDGSSDFDLTPAAESSSPIDLGSSDDFKLEVPEDDEITLADEGSKIKGPSSGINLEKPADSGISLEQGGSGDEIEFELTLDAESTPKPAKPSTPKPSAAAPLAETDSDSEFELSLDVDAKEKSDSDSEFELTLDDSGGLAALDDEPTAAEEKDIFETDFEVPPLEDSGSEAVALEDADTNLESSDFELAIGDEDVAEDEGESASQVVALDEEVAVDDAAETVQAKGRAKKGKKTRVAQAEEDFAELDEEPLAEAEEDEDIFEEPGEVAEEGGKKVIRQTVVLQQAPWGMFPALVLFPCLVVMVLLGMMGFELVQTQQGYKPGPLTRVISNLVDKK
jgi:excisionase family DNA binding protein